MVSIVAGAVRVIVGCGGGEPEPRTPPAPGAPDAADVADASALQRVDMEPDATAGDDAAASPQDGGHRLQVLRPVLRWPADGGPVRGADAIAPRTPPAGRPRSSPGAREVQYGPGSLAFRDAHAFRLTLDLAAMRQNASAQRLLRTVALLPEVKAFRSVTSVDPTIDGAAFWSYGHDVDVPGANVNVLGAPSTLPAIRGALGRSGYPELPAEAQDPTAVSVTSELFGVRDVLAGRSSRANGDLLSLVPPDRAADLPRVLAAPLSTDLTKGQLGKLFVVEPRRLAQVFPAALANAIFVMRGRTDGGLELSVTADCPDEEACRTTAEGLRDRVRRADSFFVRAVTHGVLSPLGAVGKAGGPGVRHDGKKLHAMLVASPDQVAALDGLARATLGLPP